MPNQKIGQMVSAAATAALSFPVVSAGGTSGQNKQISGHTFLQGMGIAQYVEGTCRATATVAVLPRCNIFNIYVKALVASSAAAGGSDVNVGIGTQAGRYAGSIPTSSRGLYPAASNQYGVASAMTNTSGAVVAAAPTASANASFVVGIGYFRT